MTLTKDKAEIIYEILVEMGGARDDDRYLDMFTRYLTDPEQAPHEFRFRGHFGMGGKFFDNYNRIYVSCYPEDETPERKILIEQINEALTALK